MNSYKLGCTALVGKNKQGKLKQDEHGYYHVVLGALNFENSMGIQYDFETSKSKFHESDAFMRQLRTGNLYSERAHPSWLKGMSEDEYVRRICKIADDNICAHIRDIELVPDQTGGHILIYGWVKPDRTHGADLKAALDNPHQNVCFSIRCIMDEFYRNGKKFRTITELITFDWVLEPGISVATKYNNPGLEDFAGRMRDMTMVSLTEQSVRKAFEAEMAENEVAGLESSDASIRLGGMLKKVTPTRLNTAKHSAHNWG